MEQSQNPGQSPTSAAVQAAIARRQGSPQPQLSQTSGQAPMINPAAPPDLASNANKSSAPAISKPTWEPTDQASFIVKSLVEQLKNTNKLESEKLKMASQPTMGAVPVAQTPEAQQPQPMPQPMPQAAPQMAMGGGGCDMGGGGDMFSQPLNSNPSKTGYFEFGAPSMATNSKQNQFGF